MTKQFKPNTGNRGIEWCDETRNAIGGCLHDCRWKMPDGSIAICYAEEIAEHGVARPSYPQGFKHHYWRPKQFKALARGQEPSLIFVDSMADMFAPNVPEDEVRQVLTEMRKAPHHTYQSLTKVAPQVLKYLKDLPPNLWVGVSSPPDFMKGNELSRSQQEAMLARSLAVLAEVREETGNIVWMSAEPLSWDLTPIIDQDHPMDWIVVGAATNGRKCYQPDPDHVGNLLLVMDETGTPVFYKGNLEGMFESNDLGSEELNRWREDFPQAYRDGTPIPAIVRRQQQCGVHGWTPPRVSLPLVSNSQEDEEIRTEPALSGS